MEKTNDKIVLYAILIVFSLLLGYSFYSLYI